MIAAVILLDIFTVLQSFLVAWALSRTGSDGMQKLAGEKKDHWTYNIERFAVVLIVPSIHYLVKDDLQCWVIVASWWLQFMFLQQIIHNATLNKFGVDGYGNNIKESPNTTAVIKPYPWVKLILFIIGVLLPIAYYLI